MLPRFYNVLYQLNVFINSSDALCLRFIYRDLPITAQKSDNVTVANLYRAEINAVGNCS